LWKTLRLTSVRSVVSRQKLLKILADDNRL
jgi:hypothetical protein